MYFLIGRRPLYFLCLLTAVVLLLISPLLTGPPPDCVLCVYGIHSLDITFVISGRPCVFTLALCPSFPPFPPPKQTLRVTVNVSKPPPSRQTPSARSLASSIFSCFEPPIEAPSSRQLSQARPPPLMAFPRLSGFRPFAWFSYPSFQISEVGNFAKNPFLYLRFPNAPLVTSLSPREQGLPSSVLSRVLHSNTPTPCHPISLTFSVKRSIFSPSTVSKLSYLHPL